MNTIPWLSILWLLPVAGVVVIMLLPPAQRALAKWLGLVVSVAVLAVAVMLAVSFDTHGAQYQFVESQEWIPAFGTGYRLGLDGIALVLVVLTAVLVPLLLVAGWNDAGDRKRATHTYVALTLAVEAMVLISLVSLDVLLFYVFFEAMLIPMYFLIGGFGGEHRSQRRGEVPAVQPFRRPDHARRGDRVVRTSPQATGQAHSTSARSSRQPRRVSWAPPRWCSTRLFLGFMFAFAIKAPLWPFHAWLPDAAVQSTPATAVLMMAVVDKVGTFGMLRYCLQLFPDASKTFAPLIITLAVIGIVYGAILAIGQTDVMRLIAYTSISHFGFIILGIFVMTSQGQAGSTLYMVNHGISTAALFLIAGFLTSRRGSRAISVVRRGAEGRSGTGRHVPGRRLGHAVAARPGAVHQRIPGSARAHSPLPGCRDRRVQRAGAVGDLHPVDVSADDDRPGQDRSERLRDLVPREIVVVAPLIALLLVLGVYPKPVLDVIDPAVSHTLTTIGQHDPAPKVVAK